MYPWFLYGVNSLYVATIGLVVSLTLYWKCRCLFSSNKNIESSLIVLFVFMLWCGVHATFFGCIEMFVNYAILSIVLLLNPIYKYQLLNFITKFFALFILVSLSFYVLWLIGVPLPSSSAFEGGPYECQNFYMFVMDNEYYLLPRFKSVFAEPGHLTMGLIPLIAANRMNLKNRYVLILFIAELCTFSLAGYLCLFAMGLMKLYATKTHKLAALMVAILIALGLYVTYQNSKNNDSLLYYTIFERIERYGEGNYDKLGDRFKDNTIIAYNKLMNSGAKFYGLGLNETSLKATYGSSGYKVYIIYYGIIGLVLVFFSYWSYYRKYKCRYALMLFLCCLLLFVQNAYPLWYIFIITYIIGIPSLKYNYENSIFSSGK